MTSRPILQRALGCCRASSLATPALLAASSLALARPAAAWSASCEAAQRYSLANGLEVVLVPEPGLPTVALVSSIHAGFRDDPKGHEGLAHYVEHLTFLGTPPFASAMDLYEKLGASDLNGATSADTTDYYALVPSSQLEQALWIEARRLGIGVSTQTEEQAVSEQRVLLREHAARFGYAPAYSLTKATYAELYPPQHPYHAAFASEDSIESLTLGDARWFFAQHYRPDRARLVLVGGFDPDATKGHIEKLFGALAAPTSSPPSLSPGQATPAADGDACRWAKLERQLAHKRIVQETRGKSERLEVYWQVAPGENTEVLSGTFNSLIGDLRETLRQAGLSHGVFAELVELELGAFWAIRIEVAAGQPFDEVEPLLARMLGQGASTPTPEGAMATRQAQELADQLARERLLGRALSLARRECTPRACVDSSKLAASSNPEQARRFSLASALVVERRHSIAASEDGDLEVLP